MNQTWDRILLKTHIESGSPEVTYCQLNDYQPNQHTQLAINYYDMPIFGSYRSLWKDAKLGWVLSLRTTKAVINRFMLETNISAISLHKLLEQHCDVSKHHALFHSQLALFSVNGYRGKSTSWLNFYHVNQVQAGSKRRLIITLKDGFNYEFKRVAPNIEGRIGESLRMHHTVRGIAKALHVHLGQAIVCNHELRQLNHLRDGEAYIALERVTAFFNTKLHCQTQLECLRHLAEDMALELNDQELRSYGKLADKNNSLY